MENAVRINVEFDLNSNSYLKRSSNYYVGHKTNGQKNSFHWPMWQSFRHSSQHNNPHFNGNYTGTVPLKAVFWCYASRCAFICTQFQQIPNVATQSVAENDEQPQIPVETFKYCHPLRYFQCLRCHDAHFVRVHRKQILYIVSAVVRNESGIKRGIHSTVQYIAQWTWKVNRNWKRWRHNENNLVTPINVPLSNLYP